MNINDLFKEYSDDELKQISEDILNGKIFCNFSTNNAQMIFLAFINAFKKMDMDLDEGFFDKVSFIFEYVENKKGEIYTYPQFDTVQFLSMDQSVKIIDFMSDEKSHRISKSVELLNTETVGSC